MSESQPGGVAISEGEWICDNPDCDWPETKSEQTGVFRLTLHSSKQGHNTIWVGDSSPDPKSERGIES